MAQVQLSPELARGVLQLARALLLAARNWSLYPPEHPALAASVDRLAAAIRSSSLGAIFSLGITPDTLLVEGAAADAGQAGIAEAAVLLHDRDIVQITFAGDPPTPALHALLRLLALDAAERRARGGPAAIWREGGDPSIGIEQVDYGKVLARDDRDTAQAARRDDLWKAIVTSIAGGQKPVFDEVAQRRLLSIAGSPQEIGQLAEAVIAPKHAADGSPMITTQAATVLTAFRHLTSIVSVMDPARMPEVMQNLATAAVGLDPHVVMQMMQGEDAEGGVAVVGGLAAAFDDGKVAQLLATALALDGQASDRLATIFNTIAPDEDRKRRVMTLTRHLLGETDLGRSSQFQTLWTSMEELLVSYNDKPFVSAEYRASLDGVGGRAERMALADLPPELPVWLDTLGQASIRKLSVQLLIDLLAIERDAARAGQLADDMVALCEDLLMAGAYDDARTVVEALAAHAAARNIGRDAARQALDQLGESLAMRETAALLGDLDDDGWARVAAIVRLVGASTVESLKPVMAVEAPTPASQRAEELIAGFGAAAVPRLASLVDDRRWFVQAGAARLLGRSRAPAAVPLLQPLLRRSDPRIARAAIGALGGIDDPSAARAIHTVLRAATGALRRTVVEALVADRDPRVVPMLVRIIEESDVTGADHEIALDTLAAFGRVGGDAGIPAIAGIIRRRGWFGRRKLRALKEAGVGALASIATPASTAALDDARQTGDRMLRKIVAGRSA
ncbi:MAG: HEAT repeat domain-containing protein [Acidobacteria bacterium]|nr:HEAT repeat domain-containing protein [Acidobacteriota bacterium]